MSVGSASNIQKARVRLLTQHPFFATLLLSMDTVEIDNETMVGPHKGPAAATDMKRLYLNTEKLDSWSVPQVMTVLAHEVLHVALEHGMRLKGRNPIVWNMAGDFAINLTLTKENFEAPPEDHGWLCDEQFEGMAAEQIYEHLKNNCTEQEVAAMWGDGSAGDLASGEMMDPAEAARASQEIRQKVARAAQMARMAGKLGAHLERLVGEILEPQVPWIDILRDFIQRTSKDDETWTRRNRRFQGVYLPMRHSEQMGPMIFIPDTSGSMWGDDLEKVCSEIAHCANQMQPESVKVVWADTEVKGEQDFECSEFEYEKLKPVGGGGTDMRKPLEYVEQYDPQVVILMTDGHTPWPDAEPPFPTIVVCTTDVAPPIGSVVKI